MKKIIIALALILVSVSLVITGDIISVNKDIDLLKERKDALKDIGLEYYDFTDYDMGLIKECELNEMFEEVNCVLVRKYKRCLYKEGIIDTCSGNKDLRSLDDWEKMRIEAIADATIERQNRNAKTINATGVTTIK